MSAGQDVGVRGVQRGAGASAARRAADAAAGARCHAGGARHHDPRAGAGAGADEAVAGRVGVPHAGPDAPAGCGNRRDHGREEHLAAEDADVAKARGERQEGGRHAAGRGEEGCRVGCRGGGEGEGRDRWTRGRRGERQEGGRHAAGRASTDPCRGGEGEGRGQTAAARKETV